MTRYLWDKEAGEWVERLYVPPAPRVAVWGDLPAYKSPLGTGMVEGRAARREDLKRGNCREVDPGEFQPRLVAPENAGKPGYDPDYAREFYRNRKDNHVGDRKDEAFVPE